jgi:hypothetical protein
MQNSREKPSCGRLPPVRILDHELSCVDYVGLRDARR